MNLSADAQIKRLQRLAPLSWIPTGLAVLTLVLVALGFQTGYEIFFVMAAFSALAAAAARKARPHWRNAIQATRSGVPSQGIVSISTTRDPTTFDHYVATVQDEEGSTWRFEFSPYYWQPADGDYKTQIYYLQRIAWPVLLVAEGGILFPAFTPERINQKR